MASKRTPSHIMRQMTEEQYKAHRRQILKRCYDANKEKRTQAATQYTVIKYATDKRYKEKKLLYYYRKRYNLTDDIINLFDGDYDAIREYLKNKLTFRKTLQEIKKPVT